MTLSIFKDKVKETCTFNGTGNVTMTGVVSGNQVFPDGICDYVLENSVGTIWEVGQGTITTGILVRDTVRDNSSGNTSLIDFGVGNGEAFMTISAHKVNDPFDSGQVITWNDTDKTLDIPTGLGPVLQVGQEILTILYNNTGSIITNGQAVYISPLGQITNGRPHVFLAQADSHNSLLTAMFVATHDIANASEGIFTRYGHVRDFDTSAYSNGDILWLSPTVAGGFTVIPPEFPDYRVGIGIVIASAVSGSIFIDPSPGLDKTFRSFYNGTMREKFAFDVSSNGVTVIGTLDSVESASFMTMLFSDGFSTLDISAPPTITLTAGTDTAPQVNYTYIPFSTKVLANSPVGWPSAQHIKISRTVIRSAASCQTDGPLANQNINDGLQDSTTGQGHLTHVTERLRHEGASWQSGTEAVCTITDAPTPDDVHVSMTAGKVYQLHLHDFSAQDSSTGDEFHIVNHPTTPYVETTNLNTQLLDALGISLNSTSFSFVLWAVISQDGEPNHMMINLPTGSYAFASPADAIADPLNKSVYSIPREFLGSGFLVARFTYTYKNDVWTLEDTEDLRGFKPNSAAGGGVGGVGVTTFLALTDTESSYLTKALQILRVNSGETGLEYTDTLTAIIQSDKLLTVPVLDIDFSAANVQTKAVSANSIFTFSGISANAHSLDLILTVTGTPTLTWPASVVTAPPITTGVNHLVFTTVDGGTTVSMFKALDGV